MSDEPEKKPEPIIKPGDFFRAMQRYIFWQRDLEFPMLMERGYKGIEITARERRLFEEGHSLAVCQIYECIATHVRALEIKSMPPEPPKNPLKVS